MDKLEELKDFYDFIKTVSEKQLRNILYHFFTNNIKFTHLTHGQYEEGADLIFYKNNKDDELGKIQAYLFQIKKGDITTAEWRKSLHSQLYELYDRELVHPLYNSNSIPRRIILITSGIIKDPIPKKIARMNEKNHIPIEYFDGKILIDFLLKNGYTKAEASSIMNKDPD